MRKKLREELEKQEAMINIILFNAIPDNKQLRLVMEALGFGLLDCG